MDDILEILVPIAMFAAFYFFARIQKFIKDMGERGKPQNGGQIDAEERMRRRVEALAAKQEQSRKTGTVRQAARQQRRETPVHSAPVQQNVVWQSDEEMMERLGVEEFERRKTVSDVSSALPVEHVVAVARQTSARHTAIQGVTLRQMVLAREIFDRPVSMRPPHNPFRR